MCDSDKRNVHVSGYEVRPEDVFYERKWEPLKRNVDENSLGTERTGQHAEGSKKEQGKKKIAFKEFILIIVYQPQPEVPFGFYYATIPYRIVGIHCVIGPLHELFRRLLASAWVNLAFIAT